MRGDFSRLRFSPNKNYTSVLQQQGRVSLDADANEQCAIYDYLRTTETVDVVGVVGGPVHDEGFSITVDNTNDTIEVGKGRYYVDGILCQNECPLSYTEQPFLIDPSPTDTDLLNSLQSGSIATIQVYLQVWKRLVTALDDCCLREPALGQADTTARVQTIWRVIAKGVTTLPSQQLAGTFTVVSGSEIVFGSGTSFTSALEVGEQITFASDPTLTPYTIAAISSDTSLTLTAPYAGATTKSTTASLVGPAGSCCKSMHTGLVPARDQGKLCADTGGDQGECSCEPTPAAGYRGLENQLYRVEIHEPGNQTSATFKWSRENGSVVVAVSSTSGYNVYVDSLGPDPNLGFAAFQWVELTDDTNLFGEVPSPGNLYQIQSVTPETLTVTLMQPITNPPIGTNPRMRRWDQFGSIAGVNGVSVSAGPIPLESGIEVEFSAGRYQSGDYWLIPARTATGSIDWPPCNSNGDCCQPPHRTEIFLAPLACITWNSQTGAAQVQDCRKKFYPLTELEPACTSTCCSYSVGDGQNTFGDFTSIQAAVDALPVEGGEICILPGLYSGPVRIINRRDIVIHGCGWQTRVASTALYEKPIVAPRDNVPSDAINPFAAIFTIVASQHIELRSFCIEAADAEAGVLIDGTGTSLTNAQAAGLVRLLVKLTGVIDVTIEDIVFTASTLPAVLAERVELLRIDRNRVAMRNVRSMWPAIYASGTEIHIDNNWVGVQSAANDREWLPYSVTEDLSGATTSISSATTSGSTVTTGKGGAGAPPFLKVNTLPAAAAASAQTRGFINFDGATTTVELALHPGGIQIGAPSTDVYIIENEITGGNGNGVTLGSFDILDNDGNSTGGWTGTSTTTTTTTGDCDCSSTLQTSSSSSSTTGDTIVPAGILTNIQIHRNRIRNTGLCGIGPVGFFDLTIAAEIITVVGLNISANEISRTLLADIKDSSKVLSIGYGAICVPDVQNLIVCDNTITDFGWKPGVDVCGIFVYHGEMIDISRNQVLETRDWTDDPAEGPEATAFWRGGIVIPMATPPTFAQPLDTSQWQPQQDILFNSTPIYIPALPAVRIEHNVVRTPLSYALQLFGLGPFSIVNNQFSSGGLLRARGNVTSQTVLIFNIGASIEFGREAQSPTSLFEEALGPNSNTPDEDSFNSSCGLVLFANNLCHLEATFSHQRGYTSVCIITLDQLTFSGNHCWLDGYHPLPRYNALLLGSTLNVVGNRFQEKLDEVKLSALTIGLANITGENISTNCLKALGLWVVDNNNIALIDRIRTGFCEEHATT